MNPVEKLTINIPNFFVTMNLKLYYATIVILLCLGLLSKWICIGIVGIAWSFQIIHLYCTFKDLARAKYAAVAERFTRKYYSKSGISILKPLNGLIPTLGDNLESFFALEYPLFELIICVAEENDPALEIVKKLQKQYPETQVVLSIGIEDCGQNPKLRNLATARPKYDLMWIADANIVASDCALQDMVDKCVDGARLVHQIPWGVAGPTVEQTTGALSLGSVLDRWYFATSHGRPYTVINNLFCSCVNGMSIMVSKPHLDKLGGLNAFCKHIAEDSIMGSRFDAEGYEVVMSKFVAVQNLTVFDISQYIERRVRWTRLRIQTSKTTLLAPFELIVDSHLFSWMALIALTRKTLPVAIAIVHPFAWLLVDALVFLLMDRAVGLPEKWQDNSKNNLFFDWGRISDKRRGVYFYMINMLQHYVLWVFREFIGLYIRMKALQNIDTVEWGGAQYTLTKKD